MARQLKKKKRTRRNKIKNAALDISFHPRNRKEYIDMDYISTLSEKDKKWYSKFIDEYYGANLDFKNLDNNIHNTEEYKKDCTDRTNSRNRDMFAFAKSNNLFIDGSAENMHSEEGVEIEDLIVDYIDKKEKKLNR